jgi:hypothetical protein
MKVKELIALLEKEDPELQVVVDGYEGGYDSLKKIQNVCILENQHKLKEPSSLWYIGEYKECVYGDISETAILLPRSS